MITISDYHGLMKSVLPNISLILVFTHIIGLIVTNCRKFFNLVRYPTIASARWQSTVRKLWDKSFDCTCLPHYLDPSGILVGNTEQTWANSAVKRTYLFDN